MKAIVQTGPGRLEWRTDWPLPAPGPGQVRIRTLACGICATDLRMIAGWARTRVPAVPGHEWAGTVDTVGAGVDPALRGRRCVASNVWADGGEVGFEHPGGYGEYFLTEARNVHALPPDLAPTAATLIEPLAVCVRGLQRLRVQDRRAALVFGDGPIGLLFVPLLVRAGVRRVAVVGGRTARLAVAWNLGAAEVLNYHKAGPDLAGAIRRAWGTDFPIVVEASGSGAALEAGLVLAARGGKVLVIGEYGKARARFAWDHVLLRELELIGSNASAGAWEEAVRLAADPAVPLERLVTRVFPAKDFKRAIETVRKNRRAIKVVLDWSAA